jgi:hypothetical protein
MTSYTVGLWSVASEGERKRMRFSGSSSCVVGLGEAPRRRSSSTSRSSELPALTLLRSKNMMIRKASIGKTGAAPVVLRYLRAAQIVAQIPPTAKSVAKMPKTVLGMSTDQYC